MAVQPYEAVAERLAHPEAVFSRSEVLASLSSVPATSGLYARSPAQVRLVDIEARMRCRRCGRLGPQPWSLWRAEPPVRAVDGD